MLLLQTSDKDAKYCHMCYFNGKITFAIYKFFLINNNFDKGVNMGQALR